MFSWLVGSSSIQTQLPLSSKVLLMVKLEVGLLSDHLHHHHHEITFKMIGLCFLYLFNWQSYSWVSPACCVDWHYIMRTVEMLWNALIMTVLIHIFFRNVISAIFKSLHQGQIAIALYFRPAIISTSTVFV